MIPSWLHLIIILLLLSAGIGVKIFFIEANRSFLPKLPLNVKTLLMGDSHTVKQMDPSAFTNALNLGMSGEFIYYSYYKLKKLLDCNLKPKRIILSYSYHSLASFPWFGEAEMSKRYHLLIDREFYNHKFKSEFIHQSTVARFCSDEWKIPILLGQDIIEYFELRDSSKTIPWLGAYEPKRGSQIGNHRSLKDALGRHYSKFGVVTVTSRSKREYMRNFARLCQENGIELCLVNTPVHREYFRSIPPRFIQDTDGLAAELTNYGVRYLNLSREPFSNKEFYDYDHLNQRGSEKFSQVLNRFCED